MMFLHSVMELPLVVILMMVLWGSNEKNQIQRKGWVQEVKGF